MERYKLRTRRHCEWRCIYNCLYEMQTIPRCTFKARQKIYNLTFLFGKPKLGRT